jgi:hypothetical protein
MLTLQDATAGAVLDLLRTGEATRAAVEKVARLSNELDRTLLEVALPTTPVATLEPWLRASACVKVAYLDARADASAGLAMLVHHPLQTLSMQGPVMLDTGNDDRPTPLPQHARVPLSLDWLSLLPFHRAASTLCHLDLSKQLFASLPRKVFASLVHLMTLILDHVRLVRIRITRAQIFPCGTHTLGGPGDTRRARRKPLSRSMRGHHPARAAHGRLRDHRCRPL